MKQVTCGFDELQCYILIFSHNARTNPRTDQCFGTLSKLSCIETTISYGNKLPICILKVLICCGNLYNNNCMMQVSQCQLAGNSMWHTVQLAKYLQFTHCDQLHSTYVAYNCMCTINWYVYNMDRVVDGYLTASAVVLIAANDCTISIATSKISRI